MLRELHIRDFAIIDDLSLSFVKGLNILSGETGAGKSIIMGALTLLLGGRASTEMIRSKEKEAVAEASFDVEIQSPISHQLESWGIEGNESLLVKRMVSRTGKSKAFINGNMATLQMLRQLGTGLISISGQHEHQILLQADKHIDILDDFGNLYPLRDKVELGYRRFLEISRRLDDLRGLEEDKLQKKELLCFQIKEIGEAHIRPEEEEELRGEEKILGSAQKIIELTNSAYGIIYQNPGSAIERLRESMSVLKGVVNIDDSTIPFFSTLETAMFQLEDAAHSLREYMQKVDFDQGRLEEIGVRLDEISRLKRKYGGSLEEVIRFQKKAENELEQIKLSREEQGRLKEEEQDIKEKLIQYSLELSKSRKRVASILSKKVEGELNSLGMRKTIFKVSIEKEKTTDVVQGSVQLKGVKITEKGVDEVEFLISPNTGEALRPLAKIASGGELSRIILALKRVVAQERGSPTLIFDEVDSGIGGATAEVVGKKLKEISRNQQTLCITHLPQIASFADLHQSVYKEVQNGRTTTFVRKLGTAREREEEVARMLGGATVTAKTREHAREMLKIARRRVREAQ